MRIITLFVLFFVSLFSEIIGEQPYHTTAYIDEPGSSRSLLSFSAYLTDHFWNKKGKKLPTYNHFQRNDYLLYSEYAFCTDNSLFINGGYSTAKELLHGNSQGVDDFELGWKHLFYAKDTFVLTAQCIAIIPTGNKKSSIRYGKCGAEAGLLCSNTFCLCDRDGWYDASLAYRLYQGFPSDQVRAGFSLGYYVTPRIALIGLSQLDYGVFNGKSRFNPNTIVNHSNYRLLSLQLECYMHICSHVSLTLGGFKHVWGRNVGAGGGFLGGAWIDF